jgi:hypothetical protein
MTATSIISSRSRLASAEPSSPSLSKIPPALISGRNGPASKSPTCAAFLTSYAGSVLCLARSEDPDTSAFDAPEIVYRMKKKQHAGLLVQSPDPQRVATLLDEYSHRFAEMYLAVAPVPTKPTN